jgi:hypothetical protein
MDKSIESSISRRTFAAGAVAASPAQCRIGACVRPASSALRRVATAMATSTTCEIRPSTGRELTPASLLTVVSLRARRGLWQQGRDKSRTRFLSRGVLKLTAQLTPLDQNGLRCSSSTFAPPVFREGRYTVRLLDDEGGIRRQWAGLEARGKRSGEAA